MSVDTSRKRAIWVDVVLLGLAAVAFVSMVLLGNWQISRLGWKLDLIEQVESRAYGAPIPVSASAEPPEYQRISVEGRFRHQQSLKVKAVTDLGPGNWLLTPLETSEGILWVNRGFLPAGLPPDEIRTPRGSQTVTGLARSGAQGGTLLEDNDPEAQRWVSVDLGAMSDAVSLTASERFYVDADHAGDAEGWPRGGMTRLEFRNSHLSYALTWYGMAVLFLIGMGLVIWDRLREGKRIGN